MEAQVQSLLAAAAEGERGADIWSTVLTALAIFISASGLTLSIIALLRTRRQERRKHVDSVSVFTTLVEGRLTLDNHPEVVVRNDAPAAIIVENVSIAFGSVYTLTPRRPEAWAMLNLRAFQLLPPGQEMRLPAPDPVPGPMIGAVIRMADSNGRRWQVSPAGKRTLRSIHRPPRRRDAWFERRRWWTALDEKVTMRSLRRIKRRPSRFPVTAVLIDWLWGWRPGVSDGEYEPLNAPRAWRYGIDLEFCQPEIPWRPWYLWRDGPQPAEPTA